MDAPSASPVHRLGPLIALGLAACLQVGTGGDSTAATAASRDAAADAPSVQGALCESESAGVTLCQRINLCPQVAVNPGAFPHCGFRLGEGARLDLECACSGTLCPVGVANSCAEAQTLLGNQDVLLVCQQAAEGRCLPIGADAGAGASSCNRGCESQCAGNIDCIHQLCGC